MKNKILSVFAALLMATMVFGNIPLVGGDEVGGTLIESTGALDLVDVEESVIELDDSIIEENKETGAEIVEGIDVEYETDSDGIKNFYAPAPELPVHDYRSPVMDEESPVKFPDTPDPEMLREFWGSTEEDVRTAPNEDTNMVNQHRSIDSGEIDIRRDLILEPEVGPENDAQLLGQEIVIPQEKGTVIASPRTPTRDVTNPSALGKTILLVDDDNSANNGGLLNLDHHVEDPGNNTRYQDTLQNLEYPYDVYVVPSLATGPDYDTMKDYDLVIWVSGHETYDIWNTVDESNIAQYMDAGGMVWFSGMHIVASSVDQWGTGDPVGPGDFVYDYMKVKEYGTVFWGKPESYTPNPLKGVAGSAEEGGLYPTKNYWPNDDTSCELTPTDDADPLYFSVQNYYYNYVGCTYRDPTGFSMVYTGGEWSFIHKEDDRNESMANIMNFFFPPVDYGCHVIPEYQLKNTTANTVVDYTLTLTNIGIGEPTDLYDITYTTFPENWAVSLFESDGTTPLVDNNYDGNPDTGVTSTMVPIDIVVKVTVPPGASLGDFDQCFLSFRSHKDITAHTEATLETRVPDYHATWNPGSLDTYARQSTVARLPIIIRNSAAATDSFTLSKASGSWTYDYYNSALPSGLTLGY